MNDLTKVIAYADLVAEESFRYKSRLRALEEELVHLLAIESDYHMLIAELREVAVKMTVAIANGAPGTSPVSLLDRIIDRYDEWPSMPKINSETRTVALDNSGPEADQ